MKVALRSNQIIPSKFKQKESYALIDKVDKKRVFFFSFPVKDKHILKSVTLVRFTPKLNTVPKSSILGNETYVGENEFINYSFTTSCLFIDPRTKIFFDGVAPFPDLCDFAIDLRNGQTLLTNNTIDLTGVFLSSQKRLSVISEQLICSENVQLDDEVVSPKNYSFLLKMYDEFIDLTLSNVDLYPTPTLVVEYYKIT